MSDEKLSVEEQVAIIETVLTDQQKAKIKENQALKKLGQKEES